MKNDIEEYAQNAIEILNGKGIEKAVTYLASGNSVVLATDSRGNKQAVFRNPPSHEDLNDYFIEEVKK